MSLTIDKIAKLAKVSRSTVSRAINNQEGINEKTRQRIMSIMERHNYQPNVFARAMSSNQTKSIGIFMPSFEDLIAVSSVYTDIILGITEEVTSRGYFILYFRSQKKSPPADVVSKRMLDGIIYLGMGRKNGKSIHDFSTMDIPVVSTGKFIGAYPNAFYVDIDNEQSARLACKHLVANGHTRIAHVKSDDVSLLSSTTRQQGYMRAHEESDIPVDGELIVSGDLSFEGGYEAMNRLLRRNAAFTACFAQSDNLAFGVLKSLVEHGLRVPEDVSLVGFDNVQYASYCIPALTTIDQFAYRRGRIAAKLLLDIIEKKVEGHSIDVPGELIHRDSVISRR